MAPLWPPALKLAVRLLACFAGILATGGTVSGVSLVHAGTPVEPIPSVADMIAEQLRRDPVYVSDHLPRAVPPDDLRRIRVAIARLPVRTFVAVTPTLPGRRDSGSHERRAQIPLLRDRLGADGIYLVVDEHNTGVVQQFGGSLPVEDALMAAQFELPYDATTRLLIERFVEILLSGRAPERHEAAARQRPSDVETRAFNMGALAGAVTTLAAVLVIRRLRRPGVTRTGKGSTTSPATVVPWRRRRRRRK